MNKYKRSEGKEHEEDDESLEEEDESLEEEGESLEEDDESLEVVDKYNCYMITNSCNGSISKSMALKGLSVIL